jgi:hexulose-6-phosphate isomerase
VVLKRLIKQAARIGVEVVLVPVLEEAEIRNKAEANQLVSALQACLPVARAAGVRLGLETELPADRYVALVSRFGDPQVGAYYDIGNAAARGYSLADDVRVLGSAIYGVHVKDRRRDGPSVLLGQGDAGFTACFAALNQVGYQGALILQTAFGEDYMGIAAAHCQFVQDHWRAAQSRPVYRREIT